MRKWLITNILLKVLDICSTTIVIYNNNINIERNLLVRNLMKVCGIWPGLSIVFLIFCAILYIACRIKSVMVLKITAFIMAIIVINNLIGVMFSLM